MWVQYKCVRSPPKRYPRPRHVLKRIPSTRLTRCRAVIDDAALRSFTMFKCTCSIRPVAEDISRSLRARLLSSIICVTRTHVCVGFNLDFYHSWASNMDSRSSRTVYTLFETLGKRGVPQIGWVRMLCGKCAIPIGESNVISGCASCVFTQSAFLTPKKTMLI